MSRDIERARDEARPEPAEAPDVSDDARPKPSIGAPARPKRAALPADPELLLYRTRLDQQLAAWRDSRPVASLAAVSTAPAPGFNWQGLLIWIAPIAACGAAAAAGFWIATVPATRAGEELAQVRQALQEEQSKVEKLVATLAHAWRDLGSQAAAAADREADRQADKAVSEQEREALQNALRQSEAAAATFAQSLAQEQLRNQELERQLAARPEAPPPPAPAADAASDKPSPDKPSPEESEAEVPRLLARATLLVAQGDIAGARIVLERAAETGSASALFALAETFDPAVLSAWGTVGTRGDPGRARDLYGKALAGGVTAAKDRLATLGP